MACGSHCMLLQGSLRGPLPPALLSSTGDAVDVLLTLTTKRGVSLFNASQVRVRLLAACALPASS